MVGKRMRTSLDRFLEKVRKDSLTGCWEWMASKNNDGYGKFYDDKVDKVVLAHRWSFQYFTGSIDYGFQVCHQCDNPFCCNPEHLFMGTQKENIVDAKEKGRLAVGDKNGSRLYPERMAVGDRHGSRTCPQSIQRGDEHYSRQNPDLVARGERQGCAILTDEKVIYARREYSLGRKTQIDLSIQYGVSRQTMSDAIRGKTWKHLNLEDKE